MQNAQSSTLSAKQWLIFFVLISAGLVLRWLELENRPIHHDESMHAMFGIYYFDWPNDKFYRYDPMMHGPVLYNLYPLIYNTLGISDWSIRAPIALMGSFFIFLPLIFRRFFSAKTLLALTAVLALSPSMVYWSRLIHHDELVLLGWAGMLYGVFLARERLKAAFVLGGIALQFAVKANVYITLAILIGYLIYELAINSLWLKQKTNLLRSLWEFIAREWISCVFALALAAFIFCLFYTSGFRYSEGILDGLYRKGLSYWLHQHNIERIKGPFLFHFYMFSWYELPVLGLIFLQIFLFYRSQNSIVRWIAAAIFGLSLVCAFSIPANFGDEKEIVKYPIWAFFKLKDRLDLIGLFILLFHPIISTSVHLLRGESKLAFFCYFFWSNFFAYSYAGEKTPWLVIYPFCAGLLFLALYFQDYFRKNPLPDWQEFTVAKIFYWCGGLVFLLGFVFVLEEDLKNNWGWLVTGLVLAGIGFIDLYIRVLGRVNLFNCLMLLLGLFTLRIAILTNFVYPGEANELISQVHTTSEFDLIIRDIRRQLLLADEQKRPEVLVTGEGVWPTVWYLRGLPLRYDNAPEKRPNYKWIFQDWKDDPTDVPDGFELRKVKLRGWWVPDYTQMTTKRFLAYAINHVPWKPASGGDPTGYSYIAMLSKKN